MDIQNRTELHRRAAALAGHPGGKQTALIYVGISCGLSLLLTLLDLLLNHQISNTGGLSNMGLRSILSTVQTILPIVQTLVMLGLGMGYRAAMLELYRRRTTSPHTLKEGLRRLAPMLRLTLAQAVIYIGIAIAAFYISSYVFILLPLSDRFVEIVEPVLSSINVMDGVVSLDPAVIEEASGAMLPMLWILLVVGGLLLVPVFYRYRMAQFCLCEDPVPGALAAMNSSMKMLRRKRFSLFRLDLTFWWYYGLELLAMGLSMGGGLLSLAGVELHWTVYALVFPALSLAAQFALYYFFLNRVTLTYAAAYEALRPKPEPAPQGVPLGNIFDLYRQSNEYKESQEN